MKELITATVLFALLLGMTPVMAFDATTQSVGLATASSQYLSRVDNANLSFTGNFTLEGWFKFTSIDTGVGTLITKYGGDANQRGYWFAYYNSGGTKFEVRISSDGTGGNTTTGTLAYTLNTGTWYHLAMVYTAAAGTADIFVNGTNVGTITGLKTSVFDSTSKFDIGASDGDLPSTNFNGRAFLVRAWNTTRTGAQLLGNYCTTLGATANLQGEWSLNNTLVDTSGNGFTLTNNNSATFGVDAPTACTVAPMSPLNFFQPF